MPECGEGGDQGFVCFRVEYQHAKRRFWFTKKGGITVRVAMEGVPETAAKSLAEFLNQRQDIILIGLAGGDIVYQGRNFYKIDYEYAERVLIDLIQRPANPSSCDSEKGTEDEIAEAKRSKAKTFAEHSLFNAVATQKN